MQTGIPAGSCTTTDDYVACSEAYSGLSCDAAIGHAPPTECRPKARTLVNGATCVDDGQCTSAHCKKMGDCGVCGTVSATGAACTTESDCDYGLICGASSTCVAPAAAGAACTRSSECASPLICSAKKCAVAIAVGGVCDKTAQNCDSRQGLFCNAQNVCVAVTLAGPGEACGLVGMGYVG